MGSKKAFFFGFSYWKRNFIEPFFPEYDQIVFCSSLVQAKESGFNPESVAVIWGKKPFSDVEEYVQHHHMKLLRVEDGFIRSVGLGSDLTRPYSLIVDSRGIYFDPSQESDLEYLLNHTQFDSKLIARAKNLMETIVSKEISKYNAAKKTQWFIGEASRGKVIILVPGQVEDDASVILGTSGMNNLLLLQAVREASPDAYIVFKPHPDVVAGNRKGHVTQEEAMRYCNEVVTDVPLPVVLSHANEVHTMTSLVGFEALLRGKKVATYGMPFYAGWGLTCDRGVCKRRQRRLMIEELVAVTLILYPRYIDMQTHMLCEAETLLIQMEKEKNRYNKHLFYRQRKEFSFWISRKIQALLRAVKGV